jgi:hypothetical protein
MDNCVWSAIGSAMLVWIAYRAVPIWIDGERRAMPIRGRLRWALVGIVAPSRYWWRTRIEAMSAQERAELLAREIAALGLTRADSLRCPLCGAEVSHAWSLDADGRPTVAPGPVKCPECDFRLDACRHCAHFLPGSATGTGFSLGGDEITFGRCGFYRAPQPVERIATPEVARRLKERGYESINAALPIVDSFVPPDSCRAFQSYPKRLQASGVRWPDARRVALLRLLLPRPASQTAPPEEPSGDEQWLM